MADSKAIFDDDDAAASNDRVLDSHPACLKCGQIQPMMKCCSRCHSAYYCSRPCFVQHWPVHKSSCRPNKTGQLHQSQDTTTPCSTEKKETLEKQTLYKVVHREKPVVAPEINFHREKPVAAPTINFQKAADALKDTKHSVPDPESDSSLPGQEVTIRYLQHKHKFKVCDTWDPHTIFHKMAAFLSCLPDQMKMIHKGKQLSVETVRSAISRGAVFQVLAEKMEDASGLVGQDIEVLMQQMGVERNVAIKALRNCKGDLVDAIMAIGNK